MPDVFDIFPIGSGDIHPVGFKATETEIREAVVDRLGDLGPYAACDGPGEEEILTAVVDAMRGLGLVCG